MFLTGRLHHLDLLIVVMLSALLIVMREHCLSLHPPPLTLMGYLLDTLLIIVMPTHHGQ
jgi:hypothetical protein